MDKRKVELRDYTIAKHFLCALINGDYTGLSDEEETRFNDWLDCVSEPGPHHWNAPSDCETDFRRCEILDLYADCVTVTQVIYRQQC